MLDPEVQAVVEIIKAELNRQGDEELYFEEGKKTASFTALVDGYLDMGALAVALIENCRTLKIMEKLK